MGYRLGIDKIDNVFYNTKLYGYQDVTELKSYQYLKELGLIDNDYWCAYENVEIIIDWRYIKKFIELYNDDMNNYRNLEKDWFINQPEIKEILKNEKPCDYRLDWC